MRMYITSDAEKLALTSKDKKPVDIVDVAVYTMLPTKLPYCAVNVPDSSPVAKSSIFETPKLTPEALGESKLDTIDASAS